MDHLRLLEKLSASRIANGFDRSEVLVERQDRIQGNVCRGSKYAPIWEPRRPPTSKTLIERKGSEVNMLKQELLLSQSPPQCDALS